MKFPVLIAAVVILLNPFASLRGEEVVYVVNSYVHPGASGYPDYSTVMMLRGSDLKILKTLEIPGPGGHTCVLTPDGCELWVSTVSANAVVVIDTKTFEIIKTFDYSSFSSGTRPVGLAIEPKPIILADPLVFAGMWREDIMRVYKSGSLEELQYAVDPPDSGTDPEFLTFTPDGTQLCVVGCEDTSVTLWANPAGTENWHYNLAGSALGDAVVSPDLPYKLYVANMSQTRIDCLSMAPPFRVIDSYSTAPYLKPRGIAIGPDGNYLFTSHYIPGGSKVVAWRINPWAEVASADLPDNGRRIAANNDCTRLYVTDHNANKVFVYRVDWSLGAAPGLFIASPHEGRDLDTIAGYQASPVGIAVGEWENIGVFREASGLWAIKGVTRAYFGQNGDIPVPGKYGAVGGPGIGIFRPSSGLWAIQGMDRVYFGGSTDIPVPADYDGDGFEDVAIFRPSSGLWAVRGQGRAYLGRTGDQPVPADYNGDGTDQIAVFRQSSGLWASPTAGRQYFGGSGDIPVPGDYLAAGNSAAAGIFRPSSGLWAIQGSPRVYFGGAGDEPAAADFNGDGKNDYAVFRAASGLWAVSGVTRTYFGSGSDIPVTR